MKVKLIKTILFRDHNGNDLRLDLGKIEDVEAYNRFMGFGVNDDRGFRWRFVGCHIPMPIRSYEWFNGFPEDVMGPWVTSQGYDVVAVTSHVTGSVYVVKGNETPCAPVEPAEPEAPKGNEPVPVKYVVDDGCNSYHSLSIYDNFADANRYFQNIRARGWLNSRIYKATEYGKDDKGNETYELTEQAIRNGNEALTEAIKLLCSQGMVLNAIGLYRLVHPCCLKDAKEAVDKIRFP